jgi:hypothetical protein
MVNPMIHVRLYVPTDRAFVLGLAPRLLIGMPPWRDQQRWLATVEGWIKASLFSALLKRFNVMDAALYLGVAKLLMGLLARDVGKFGV